MAKVVLSKSGLQKERENLKLYRKVLPSLDLKRRQLLGEQRKAEKELNAMRKDFAELPGQIVREIPMLGAGAVNFSSLIKVHALHHGIENVVGVKLPTLESVEFDEADYSLLSKPHWVDPAIGRIHEYAELRARLAIQEERVEVLQSAARKITQRVNLFEKILIPNAEENIKRIQIYLADAERAAVVQSKIAKARTRKRMIKLRAEEAALP